MVHSWLELRGRDAYQRPPVVSHEGVPFRLRRLGLVVLCVAMQA